MTPADAHDVIDASLALVRPRRRATHSHTSTFYTDDGACLQGPPPNPSALPQYCSAHYAVLFELRRPNAFSSTFSLRVIDQPFRRSLSRPSTLDTRRPGATASATDPPFRPLYILLHRGIRTRRKVSCTAQQRRRRASPPSFPKGLLLLFSFSYAHSCT